MFEFEGMVFDKIRKFDCHVVHLENERGGSYCTVIPISPLEHREKRRTRASVSIVDDGHSTTFVITDDWGKEHKMVIDNIHAMEIEAAKDAAESNGLYSITPPQA
jgi:hypothetical protein